MLMPRILKLFSGVFFLPWLLTLKTFQEGENYLVSFQLNNKRQRETDIQANRKTETFRKREKETEIQS